MTLIRRYASVALPVTILLTTIVGCSSSRTSPTVTATIFTPSPMPPMPSLIPTPTATPPPPAPVLIWFLIDRSKSMNTYCDTSRQVLWQLADFSLYLGATIAPEDVPLYFGVEWLGPYERKLDPTSARDLAQRGMDWSVSPTGIGDSPTNEYVEALEAVLNTNFAGRQAVLLLTDGTFSRDNKDNKERILSALERLYRRGDTEVYVILCNNRQSAVQEDIQFWKDHAKVYSIDGIAEWLPNLLQEISGNSWPVGVKPTPNGVRVSGWLTTTGKISVPGVPGDVAGVSAYVLAFCLSEELCNYLSSFKWRQSTGDFDFLEEQSLGSEKQSRLWLYSTRDGVRMQPLPRCQPHDEVRIMYDKRWVGFYWADFTRPEVSMRIFPSISISNEDVTSINNKAVGLTIALEGIELEWLPCYRTQLRTEEGAFGPANFNADGNAYLTWFPSAGGPPRTVRGQVDLIVDTQIVTSTELPLRVMFEPQPMSTQKISAKPGNALPLQYTMEFQFEYAPELPEVLLCTEKESEDIHTVNGDPDLASKRGYGSDGGSLQCPVPKAEFDSPLLDSIRCYQVQGDGPLSSMQVANVHFEPKENYRIGVQVQMYEFLLEQQQCGYRTIVFRWPESSNTHSVEWTWEYENGYWNLLQQ